MIDWFINLNYVVQALLATLFTWFITLLGASIVFFFKNVNKNLMDSMLGFSAGVMLAASFFSLLNPAIEISSNLKMIPALVLFIGFSFGCILLFLCDKIYDKTIKKKNSKYKSITLLILSITLHNIPEGLSVGVIFGSLGYNIDNVTLVSACMLALGIGIQNFPEGSSVSLPLKREGVSSLKSFIYGGLSAIVEPISGVIGALLVLKMRILLPYLLSFAAGSMIYVVISELIPESQTNKNKNLITLFTLIGFLVMMILDISIK